MDFDLICERCGNPLTYEKIVIVDQNYWKIKPCKTCMRNLAKEMYNRGLSDGLVKAIVE